MKLDHHCYWVGNCIGAYNTKFFLQYGIYCGLLDFIIIKHYFLYFYGQWNKITINENSSIIISIIISYFVAFNFLFMTCTDLLFHLIRGNTFIEMKFFKNQEYSFYHPYNLGTLRNILHTFGSPTYCGISWILPFPYVYYVDDNWNTDENDLYLYSYFPISDEYM